MSTNGGDSIFPTQKPPLTGIKAALQYTGIPPSWLDKRPRLPSRNWLIFLSVTSTVAGYYIYDRRECKRIRKEYEEKVRVLSQVPLPEMTFPRKVVVYGCKWPGDEEWDRSMKYFRKYIKPVLVAAAVDYEMVTGRRHGDLAERVANEIKSFRRQSLGLEPPPAKPFFFPGDSVEAQRQRLVESGIVIVGRPTFKEYLAGLKRGWTEGLEVVDKEEELARVLENDGRFDEEPLEKVDLGETDGEPLSTKSKLPSPKDFAPFVAPLQPATSTPSNSQGRESLIPDEMNKPPATIPPQPPMLLVSFLNYIGLKQIPLMMWDFFNERYKVKSGAQDAYRLIIGQTRPFNGPPPQEFTNSETVVHSEADSTLAQDHQSNPAHTPTDLDFDKAHESYYKSSVVKNFLSDIQKYRDDYYSELSKKLKTARELARHEREPTKDERNYPPPTEVELRAERMKKELRWRGDEKGWEIVRPETPVAWDERFRDVLNVYVDPLPDREAEVLAEAAVYAKKNEEEQR